VRTNADYIPLPGSAAYQSLDEAPDMDFRKPRRIGALELNHAYADLHLDADGRARTRLRDPASGMALAVWQESGVMLVFSADTVNRDKRRALALEPMESMADAFNRDDCAAAIRLEPGTERHYRCGVEMETL
jgi:aldose 1-epimerase